MRPIFLLIITLLSLNTYAQTGRNPSKGEKRQYRREKFHQLILKENEQKRRQDSIRANWPPSHNKPYVDILVMGGVMFPKISPHDAYRKIAADASIGSIVSGGLDLMFNSKQKHVFVSFGQRFGYSNCSVTTSESERSGNHYIARSIHTGLDVGFNYTSNSKGPISVVASGHLQAGFKVPLGNGPGMEPYVMPEVKLGLRINHTLGVNIGGFYQPIDAWKGNPLHMANSSIGFNVYGITAELRLSLGGNK